MSNLSDLMPAGASGKTIEATATATIASKAPVILNSAGTVSPISETTVASDMPLGSDVQYATTTQWIVDLQADPHNSNRWIACWGEDDGGNKDIHLKIFTLSGTTWTESSLIVISLDTSGDRTPCIAWDKSTADKVLLVYNRSSNAYGAASVGTISGSAGSESISWGTEHVFNSAIRYGTQAAPPKVRCLDTSGNYFTYYVTTPQTSSFGIVLQVSGTTVTSGTETALATTVVGRIHAANMVQGDSTKIIYGYNTTSTYPALRQLTLSGTTITVGSEDSSGVAGSDSGFVVIPMSATKTIVMTGANGNYPNYIVATNDGAGSFTWGTATTFESSNSLRIYADNNMETSSTLISYYVNSSGTRYYRGRAGTVNGAISSITFDAEEQLTTTDGFNNGAVAQQSDTEGTCAFVYATTAGNANLLLGETGSTTTNLTASNFVGIADAGIATSATGTIVVQGGSVSNIVDTTYTVTVAGSKFVIDGVSQDTLNLYEGSTYKFDQAEATNATHPLRLSAVSDGTHGSPAAQVFTSESSLDTPCITYDTTNDKIVIAYRYWSGSANVGAVIVGTVSGNSITYGTPVDMPTSAVPTYTSITYDSNANRVVISYRDGDNSDYGTSVVVTISGTTPSFGTPVVFESANSPYISSTYDSDANKVVIAYQDVGNSSYGTAIVGNVSGTSISFGTAVPFVTANAEYIGCTFDSSNNKTVIAYKKNDGTGYGTGIVGTVSGTTISFGTETTFQSNPSNEIYATFDSTANKTVFAYQLGDGSDYGNSVVGTVSGTGISFGSAATFNSASTNNIGLAYDATADTTTIAFKKSSTTNYGTKIEGTVAGTGISFGSEVVFEAATATQMHLVYDPDQGKIVISYIVAATPAGKTIVYPVSEYTTGVTTNGTPGSAGAYTQIVVASGAPTLYYYCSSHSGYGGTANTPSYDIGSNYYVQNDGTISSVSTSVKAGLATSATQLLLNGDS